MEANSKINVQTVPKEILCIIPKYDGDEKLLNLFISKCEYVLSGSRIAGNATQELYLFHLISSKLTGKAAALLSDNPTIASWERLKDVLTQHFGDPRSEECIALELESIKLNNGESYIQLCHRIQNTRSSLFSKVNRLTDEGIKAAKMIIYNNTALNIFLYNLPEELIRIVRLKGCSNLESALSIVTEEVNFQAQYNAKHKAMKHYTGQPHNTQNSLRPSPMGQDLKPTFNNNMMPQFKFGIPQNQGFRPNFVQPNQFVQPQGFQYRPAPNQYQRNFNQPHFGQPQAPLQHGGFKFGIPQQGPRLTMQNKNNTYPNQFKFGIPQQGPRFNTQNQSNIQPNQFKFGIPNQRHAPALGNTDVSMRTAPVRQNMIANDLYYMEESSPYQDYTPDNNYDTCYDMNDMCNAQSEQPCAPSEGDCYYLENQEVNEDQEPENFQDTASKNLPR